MTFLVPLKLILAESSGEDPDDFQNHMDSDMKKSSTCTLKPISYEKIHRHQGPIDKRALSNISPAQLHSKLLSLLGVMQCEVLRVSHPYKIKARLSETTPPPSKKNGFVETISSRISRLKKFGFQMSKSHGYVGSKSPPESCEMHSLYHKPLIFTVSIHRVSKLDLLIVDLKFKHGEPFDFRSFYHEFISEFQNSSKAIV